MKTRGKKLLLQLSNKNVQPQTEETGRFLWCLHLINGHNSQHLSTFYSCFSTGNRKIVPYDWKLINFIRSKIYSNETKMISTNMIKHFQIELAVECLKSVWIFHVCAFKDKYKWSDAHLVWVPNLPPPVHLRICILPFRLNWS